MAKRSRERERCVVEVDGIRCERPSCGSRGYCNMHYQRWRKDGNVGPVEAIGAGSKRTNPDHCTVEGCKRGGKIVMGFCATHYLRFRKTGDPGPVEEIRRKRPRCTIDDCDKPTYESGDLCQWHYGRLLRYGDPLGTRASAPRPLCSIDNCDAQAKSRGMCANHYAAWYREHQADPDVEWHRSNGGVKTCEVDGCERLAESRGMCGMHYTRWLKVREVGEAEPRRRNTGEGKPPCSVDGCERPVQSKGFCGMHYQRFTKYGDPGSVEPMRRPMGDGSYANGYRIFTLNGRTQGEHRIIMEGIIGRALRDDETVHHINGVRDDNRPENLELWSSRHPFGQRTEELVEWAVELLQLYAPERLAVEG